MKNHSRYQTARKLLIFWCLFIGIGALCGSMGMLSAPDGSNMGMEALLPYFQVLPFADILFQNYIFPGIALLTVNGIPNIIAAVLLLKNKKSGIVCGMIFGLTLMAWIGIQLVIFPCNFMSNIFFVFGILQALTGLATLIFYKQEHFILDMKNYSNISSNHTSLVVYFSRMGYTKKAALEEANRTGADLYEVKATEPTQGTLGFWWCGRFGMHRWDMPIEPIRIDLKKYSHVTICSPIWVFHVAAPMRSFLKCAKGKIKEVDYIITHFNKCRYNNAVFEMDSLLGIKSQKAQSVCIRWGKVQNVTSKLLKGE